MLREVSSTGSSSTTTAEASSTSSATAESSFQASVDSTASESASSDSGGGSSNTVLIVAILAVAVVILVLAVVVRKLFYRACDASEDNVEEAPSPPATVRTASFSSNGAALEAHNVLGRSAIGTDLSSSKPVDRRLSFYSLLRSSGQRAHQVLASRGYSASPPLRAARHQNFCGREGPEICEPWEASARSEGDSNSGLRGRHPRKKGCKRQAIAVPAASLDVQDSRDTSKSITASLVMGRRCRSAVTASARALGDFPPIAATTCARLRLGAVISDFVSFAAASIPNANAYVNAFAASTAQCASVTTCYEGGATSTPCTVSSGGCPPCVTFADDGCYVKVSSGSCPFGVDCSSVWDSSTTSSGSSTSSTTTSSGSSTTSGTTTSSGTSSGTSTNAGTSSKSAPGTSGTAGVSSRSKASSASGSSGTAAGDPSGGGSDMSVVFAIIGAAIGVIAVAVIFLTLVRRSKAAREDDDDDMANTPPAFSKNPVVQAPHSTTGAATYSSYGGSNRAAGMGSGGAAEIGLDVSKGVSKGVSMNAVSYYNQQPPQNSTAPSPRVAGRAIPSQPVGMNQSTGMARPYGGSQNYGQMGASGVQLGASGVGVANQAPPTPVQHIPMGGVAPSPHTRRESYEF
ncbi:unnamed protein product [Phytophthora lilii]|uniref:Unnamed protein product n=1 Tax=Phytophthora lilii TaxID=2077276 RepID=A0A9W6UAE2_9STRA|nr:unnamed protein product [Phytophthora lilii]